MSMIGRMPLIRTILRAPSARHFSGGSSYRARQRDEVDFDAPIKFSSSKAAQPERPPWMLNPKLLSNSKPPKYQALSIYLSMVSLLIYFCILRKENDIDEVIFANSLYDKVDGLEKQDLLASLSNATLSGSDARAIRQRLKEIEAEEKAAALTK